MKEKILVVDDEPEALEVLCEFLESSGYDCLVAGDGIEALEVMKNNSVAVVLADIIMPRMDGIRLLREIRSKHPFVEVIMETIVEDLKTSIQAFKLGACDYLTKPLSLREVLISVEGALEKRQLTLNLRKYQEKVEKIVEEQVKELEIVYGRLRTTNLDSVRMLVRAVEAKDPYTRGHCERVGYISLKIAKEMKLPKERLETLEYGAYLHDIGKIGIKEEILTKPGDLTKEEYEHIKSHPLIGEKIVQGIEFFKPTLPLIRSHHECYDGKGYPDGLKGEEIPFLARIISLCDAFDAMTSDRSYREAYPVDQVLAEIKANTGLQFDPDIVEAFFNLIKREPISRYYFEYGTFLNFAGYQSF